MIQLPADLAEVLKTVQKNENGKDIAFPDANEELLADLAAAWDKWNQVADTHVRAIAETAQRAMESMSGPAADTFQQYLQKFAGGEDSHVATTLQSGRAVAKSLHGASGAVIDTKNEMVRELQYAKTYMEQNPAGKHDDIANSEGIKQAAAVYHQYVGAVGSDVDGMLRKNAGHIADMTGMAQTCNLNGAGGAGGAGGPGGVGGVGADMTGGSPSVVPAGLRTGADGNVPGSPLGVGAQATPHPFSLPDAPGAPGSHVGGVGATGGIGGIGSTGGIGGVGSTGGVGGVGSTGGASGGPALTPFKLPTPNMPNFGQDGGAGGGGTPAFHPFSSSGAGPLNLAGLGDLGNVGNVGTNSSGASHYSPLGSGNYSPGTGVGPSGGVPGGSPFGNIGGMPNTGGYKGSSGSSPSRRLTPFSGGGGSPFGAGGSTARGGFGGSSARGGGAGGGVGSAMRGGGAGAGVGSSSLASRAGGGAGLGASGKGLSGASSAAGRIGSSGLASGGAAGRGGGAAGGAGMGAGGHMPGTGGAGRGGGGKDNKGANRFLSATRFGAEGEEEDELLHDSGILGQAGDVGPRDRNWSRARRRWLDDARAEGHFAAPETAAAPPAPAGPASEQEALSQLAGILLGTGGGAEAGADAAAGAGAGAGAGDAAADATATGGGGGSASGLAGRREAAAAPAETSADSSDDAYLDRARSVAARRGHGDAPAAGAAGSAGSASSASSAGASATSGSAGSSGSGAAAGEGGTPQRAPLREEGGFQVPSPFLRAALSRLATAPGAPAAG
ncbi:hypothetical protein ACIHEI_04090 [Kitasatospora sp. NPDC051984]|uniref:WXG100-like domain-containing protein n=1 Tax=Kitasatospora sp. NPDC051984 TaxID=3364059 RepID=UPI0037C6A269